MHLCEGAVDGRLATRSAVDIVARVKSLLEAHPAVRSVRLIGSRQQGTETNLSDWDFEVATTDFKAVAEDLPTLVGGQNTIRI